MIVVDANLLIHAVNLDAPQHERARRWLQDVNPLDDAAPRPR